MGYKRLEKGKFDFPTDEPQVQFTWEEFEQLLSGMPIVLLKSQKKRMVYWHHHRDRSITPILARN